jgi:diketogulonate reductase-like aldo/keto reductase
VRENRGALELELDSEDVKLIDEAFPPPRRPEPLEVI